MNARELRIGNWANTLSGDIQIVDLMTNINKVGANTKVFTNGITFNIDTLQPIPLTEEWLKRFGFETDKVCWFLDGVVMGDFQDGFWFLPNGSLVTRSFKIKHVHQLQNLYHALTGQELELKSVSLNKLNDND
jgi:hypothetical protein